MKPWELNPMWTTQILAILSMVAAPVVGGIFWGLIGALVGETVGLLIAWPILSKPWRK